MKTNNRPGPQQLHSDGLIRYLRGQGEKLPERHVKMLWNCVDQLTLTERLIDQAERDLAPLLESDTFREARRILDSFHSMALVAAATILGEVGDFTRFPNGKAIACFAGLNPRVFSSADKHRIGGIAKAGSRNLRWMLQQAAWTAIRCDDRVKRIFHRIARRSGRKAAATGAGPQAAGVDAPRRAPRANLRGASNHTDHVTQEPLDRRDLEVYDEARPLDCFFGPRTPRPLEIVSAKGSRFSRIRFHGPEPRAQELA